MEEVGVRFPIGPREKLILNTSRPSARCIKEKMKTVLNYLGQLRIYSFLDLLVFATALTKEINIIVGIGLLWLGFLFYLESRHDDEFRLKINKYLWTGPFAFSLVLLPVWICLSFALFSYLYTKKKQHAAWGVSAPLWRALQNGIIAAGFNFQLAILAFILIFIRNVIADFRDAHDDKQRGILTIPVVLGVGKNQAWAFYVHLMLVVAATIIWLNFSFFDSRLILPIILFQLFSYPLTPRLSNPRYLNIYG